MARHRHTHKSPRVLICNQHALFRAGIKAMLRKGAPLEIVGETDKAARAVELSRERHPDVVLMDVTTRDLPGAEATRRIKKIDPNIQVLIVSLNDDKTLTSRCLAEGAAGCVPVNAHSVELKSAINTVWRRRPHAA